ncbi:MAG: GAF domain-containing protein [Chloroflexi bacterium]|nr:MAG: GAF domain-containing protein [Chloroflexota bacterium]
MLTQTQVEGLFIERQRQVKYSNPRRARQLGTLIQMGGNLSSSPYIGGLLSIFAKRTVEVVSATYCRVSLLDEAGEVLTIRAEHAVRKLPWRPDIGERYSLPSLPKHRMAVEKQEIVIVRRDVPLVAARGEELRLLGEDIKSAALVPVVNGEGVLAILTIGEMRSWERSPFDSAKLQLLRSLAMPLSSTLMYARLLQRIVQAYEQFSLTYEQTLEAECQKAVARFALTIADEFAQPLTGASGFAQLLLKDTSPTEGMRYQSLLKILNSCEKMNAIVHNLRVLAD